MACWFDQSDPRPFLMPFRLTLQAWWAAIWTWGCTFSPQGRQPWCWLHDHLIIISTRAFLPSTSNRDAANLQPICTLSPKPEPSTSYTYPNKLLNKSFKSDRVNIQTVAILVSPQDTLHFFSQGEGTGSVLSVAGEHTKRLCGLLILPVLSPALTSDTLEKGSVGNDSDG